MTKAPVKSVALVFCEEFYGVNIPPQINSPSGFNRAGQAEDGGRKTEDRKD